MKTIKFLNNKRDFYATCSNEQIKETDKTLYKFCNMFGPKTLILWKKSGKISTRIGHNNKNI